MEDVEDFTYLVRVPNGSIFHFREITPRDFYFTQVIRQTGRSQLEIVDKLLLNPSVLDEASSYETRLVLNWFFETLLDKAILSVENWLEVAYHLCKQRWDSSIDWLENQPMSKINLMIDIVKKHSEDQEREMKKNARRK